MNKKILFAPLMVVVLGLSSCNKNKTYTIDESNNLDFTTIIEGTEISMNTFGYVNLKLKKDNNYLFKVKLTNNLIKHESEPGKSPNYFCGFFTPLATDENTLNIKNNGADLKKITEEEMPSKEGYRIFAKGNDSTCIMFSDPVVGNFKENDNIELSFKVSESVNNGLCVLYYTT